MKNALELRWNPILEEWVAIAAHRQERPQLPEDWCPFCPESGLVPKEYDVYIYPNDFPTFSIPPPEPTVSSTELYRATKSVGVCEVILYHPDHNIQLAQLNIPHIVKIVRLWQRRFKELEAKDEIKYIFIFENKGTVIGVTIHHPHGQIYAFPYIPAKIDTELNSSRVYFQTANRCLFCDVVSEEKSDRRRIVFENKSFIALVPFFARWPYEVHIYSRRHLQAIIEFAESEVHDFASILKIVTQKYDNLYGFPFPYIMVMHQAPTDGKQYPFYHFHVEFYPPYRSKTKLKYLAGVESGAGTFINDTIPEETASELLNTPPLSEEKME